MPGSNLTNQPDESNKNDLSIGTAATFRGQWPEVGGEMWNIRIPVSKEETTIVLRPGEDLRQEIAETSEAYGVPLPEIPPTPEALTGKIKALLYLLRFRRVPRTNLRLAYFGLGVTVSLLSLAYFCC